MKLGIKIIALVLLSTVFNVATAQYAYNSRYSFSKHKEKVDFTQWSKLLRNHTSIFGTVNYTAFKLEKNTFNEFLNQISKVEIKNNWTQDEQKAYWVNLYNAYSLKLIVDHFPIREISEIKKPYKNAFFEVNGKMTSLNDIEAIIKGFNDPRLLLVLNKNSMSGIRLIKRAYTPTNLNELLDKRIRIFVNNKSKNKITEKEVKLSNIFKTYEKEIVKANGSVANFINQYSDITVKNSQITYASFEKTINSLQTYGK